jgi:hypothetical protein
MDNAESMNGRTPRFFSIITLVAFCHLVIDDSSFGGNFHKFSQAVKEYVILYNGLVMPEVSARG